MGLQNGAVSLGLLKAVGICIQLDVGQVIEYAEFLGMDLKTEELESQHFGGMPTIHWAPLLAPKTFHQQE